LLLVHYAVEPKKLVVGGHCEMLSCAVCKKHALFIDATAILDRFNQGLNPFGLMIHIYALRFHTG